MRGSKDQTWDMILRLTRQMASAIREGEGDTLLQFLHERGRLLEALGQDQRVPDGLRQEILALDEEHRNGIKTWLARTEQELLLLPRGLKALAAYRETFREAIFVDRAL